MDCEYWQFFLRLRSVRSARRAGSSQYRLREAKAGPRTKKNESDRIAPPSLDRPCRASLHGKKRRSDFQVEPLPPATTNGAEAAKTWVLSLSLFLSPDHIKRIGHVP